MFSLHTNAASLSTQNSLTSSAKKLTLYMQRLGTGYRVNSAMDDAAGLQIATRLQAQAQGMQVAQRNTQNGVSMLQTAEGALDEVGNILLRMKDLATESANATASQADRNAMQAEYNELGKQMGAIMAYTRFGGANLFATDLADPTSTDPQTAGGVFGNTVVFQIGASASEQMTLNLQGSAGQIGSLWHTVSKLDLVADTYTQENGQSGAAAAADEIKTANSARGLIGPINDAINSVASLRSALGAAANRLEHTFNNLGNMIQNTQAAKGRIMDVDYATETSNMTSKQMLMQASTSMLKQSNSMSQMVASLLQ